MADIAFNDTWQMLQTNCWPDEKLAILQHEWESTNFLAILPETMAFARAIFVYDCQLRNQQNPFAVRSLLAIAGEAINDPASAHRDITNGLDIMRYHGTAAWTDEKNLLLHFRDRELELRHAIQSPTWAEMHKQPGVTNSIPFKPEYVGLMEYINNSEIERPLLLMQAAASEAERRILITAIALERYRGKHGSYPNSLALLSQEFLKAVPVNYMDGQPLRYRPTADGHFVLYSVGLDCVDDGGKPPAPGGPRLIINNNGNFAILTNQDIVWPVPASP